MIRIVFIRIFLASSIFFCGCQSSSKNQSSLVKLVGDDICWIEQFFEDLLLENHGIFTLWDAKPISSVIIDNYDEETIQTYMESLTEKELKNARVLEHCNFKKNWENWKKIADKFPSKKYILFEKTLQDDPEIKIVYFVNKLATALVIQKNYAKFKEVLGCKFDPILLVTEIQNPHSQDWKKIWSDYFLCGLLYGYGENNAYAFNWRQQHSLFFSGIKTFTHDNHLRNKKINLKNFPPPYFISFFEDDPTLEMYKQEKERINRHYKNKNFAYTSLEKFING